VSQEHWIQNKSVQDNVLFFSPMEEDRYMDVMDASQLSRDLLALPHADKTEIGERGINLSGGQKARINIARAMYTPDVDLYLFDDPLAAVDAHVSSAVFRKAILEQLHDKARVMVMSSNYHYLKHFDRVIVVTGDGTIDSFESYDEMVRKHPTYRSSQEQGDVSTKATEGGFDDTSFDGTCNGIEEADSSFVKSATTPSPSAVTYRQVRTEIHAKQELSASLVGEEDRERGQVSLATVASYYGATLEGRNGLVVFGGIILAFIVAQAFRVLNDLWIGIWAEDVEKPEPRHSQSYYITLFSVFFVATCIFVPGRSAWFLHTCLGASRHLHGQILRKVVAAPINKWFDITPIGRILNRFTKDLDAVDALLPDFLLQSMQQIFHILAVIIICIVSTPFMAIVILPVALAFFFIQRHFRKSSRELKRLDGVTRSPIYNHFGEMLAGLSTIRAYKKENTFINMHHHLCDINKRCFFAFNMTSRWLSLRLDIISACLILFLGVIAVALSDSSRSINTNLLGIGLVYSMQIIGMLQWAVRMVIETENSLTSVERLQAFNSIPSEAFETSHPIVKKPAGSGTHQWPREGGIEISNLTLRHREGLPCVLNIAHLSVPGGCKVGVCGRTGAG
jgi:ABC-type multidrug transport system fused ATPase/permease subunit